MNRQEHLLTIGAEEAVEVAQRLTKSLRFGLDDVQEGQPLNNRERLLQEYTDLVAVLDMIGIHPSDVPITGILAKRTKVEKYLDYAFKCGTLQP